MSQLRTLLKRSPIVRDWLARRRVRDYLSEAAYGQHYGRFASFAEARAWLPASREFAQPGFQDEYVAERSARVFPFDYPVMFWLSAAFSRGDCRVFDFGGSVGVHFYAYQSYFEFPEAVRWTVCELPATAELGRSLARERGAEARLAFQASIVPEVLDHDVFIAAGVLEFIDEWSLPSLLQSAARQPRHVLLNKMPLNSDVSFVSTQNLGKGAFAPHHVYHRAEFVAAMERAGYALVDTWAVPDRRFNLPDDPVASFGAYSGLYFRATGRASA